MKTIKLTKGMFALVDDEDFEEINKYKWHAQKIGRKHYASRTIHVPNGKRVAQRMHCAIIKTPEGMDTDHIDGDGLNNTKNNLRVCTRGENLRNQGKSPSRNKSGFKGVSWFEKRRKWVAQIGVGGKNIGLGHFKEIEQAHEAYVKACIKYHGEFANYAS
jgi:hypothetical protein